MDYDKKEGTIIYGESEETIWFRGEFSGQISHYGTDVNETGILIAFSDGTILHVQYSMILQSVWSIEALSKGVLFDRIEDCRDGGPWTDVCYLKPGITTVWAAPHFTEVKE